MKAENLQLLAAVRKTLDDITIRGYENVNMMLGVMQVINQIIKTEASLEGEERNENTSQ